MNTWYENTKLPSKMALVLFALIGFVGVSFADDPPDATQSCHDCNVSDKDNGSDAAGDSNLGVGQTVELVNNTTGVRQRWVVTGVVGSKRYVSAVTGGSSGSGGGGGGGGPGGGSGDGGFPGGGSGGGGDGGGGDPACLDFHNCESSTF